MRLARPKSRRTNPNREKSVSDGDTFELKATISRLEKYRAIAVGLYLAAVVALSLFWPGDASSEAQIVSFIVIVVGAVIHREVIECRLDTVRSSLRDMLTKRDPSILNDPDW